MMRFRFRLPTLAPLLMNGYALVLNAGMTAALGILFWMVATRFYSQEQVGLAAALISSMTTISYFAQMNLSSFLTRFLPASETGAGLLIVQTYALAGTVSALVALVFASGVGIVAEPLEIIGDDAGLMSLFVGATVLWTIFALQDAALAGLRRATLVPLWNTVYAVAKIGLVLGLAVFALYPAIGIFLAWTLPLLPVVIVVNAMIYGRLGRLRPEPGHHGMGLSEASRFWGWDFLGSLALGAAFGMAPLLVTAEAGAEATAAYHLAWSFAYSIYLVGRAMSTSLVAEGATDPVRLRRLIADSLTHTLVLIAAGVAVIVLFAPGIMGLFGPDYVEEGAPVLRLLALSCLPWAVTTMFCAVARVRRQTRSVAAVQVSTLAVFVATSVPLVAGFGARGVAFGWLVAHTVVCAGIVVRVLLVEGRMGLLHWALSLAGSGQRLAAALPRATFAVSGRNATIPSEVIEGLGRSVLRGMTVGRVTGSVTDVAVLMLQGGSGAVPETAVLKYSASAKGVASLRRNSEALRSLAGDPRLGAHAALLPRVILEERWGQFQCAAETVVPGSEGRNIIWRGRGMGDAMAEAAATLADIHRRTATMCLLDEGWARDWIDGPVEVMTRAYSRKAEALARLRAELRAIFIGRKALLGLGHGDVWPGNLFFAADQSNSAMRLTGIVDWDTRRTDAPAALDACQLCLAVRMERSGEELGPVVRTLLREERWAKEEMDLFAAAGLAEEVGQERDPDLRRGLLLLTWLRHVAMVIGQSEGAEARRFWSLMNVDLVLESVAERGREGSR